MKTIKLMFITAASFAVVFCGLANFGFAGGLENVTINGFAHQSYVKTDTNQYIVDDSEDGSVDDYVVGLTFTAKASDPVSIKAQFIKRGNNDLELDWGFGEFRFHKNFGLKAGKIKLPLGLFTETMDVKALQPFSYLPGFYFYGLNAYHGLGLFSSYEHKSGWGGEFEIYGGKSGDYFHDFFGQQTWITPPIDGLRFGFTFMKANMNHPAFGTYPIKVAMGSGEYVGEKLFGRSEFTNIKVEDSKLYFWYAEAGYLVHPMFQPVVRYARSWNPDMSDAELTLRNLTEAQNTFSFGVNVFPAEGVVLKAEHHINDGSAGLSATQETSGMTKNMDPDDKWNLSMVSVAFMF